MVNSSTDTCVDTTSELDLDNDQIYDSSTGQTINDIEDITEDQLKEILKIKKESSQRNQKI